MCTQTPWVTHDADSFLWESFDHVCHCFAVSAPYKQPGRSLWGKINLRPPQHVVATVGHRENHQMKGVTPHGRRWLWLASGGPGFMSSFVGRPGVWHIHYKCRMWVWCGVPRLRRRDPEVKQSDAYSNRLSPNWPRILLEADPTRDGVDYIHS